MNDLHVFVWMVAYNHEGFIKETIESVMMQQTNFNYKLFIGEDFSKDNTREICKKLKVKYPDKIELFLHEKNIGATSNGIFMYEQCIKSKAKYLALCEGDDYWIDPSKLQKQVDFLEGNLDFNICFHDVNIYNQSKGALEVNNTTRKVQDVTDINDLAKGNYIHTPSVVLRNNFKLPKWYSNTYIGDWSLYMLVVKDGKIKKLDDVMAVYRVHNKGIWALKTEEYRILNTIKSFELFLNSEEIKSKTKDILNITIQDLKRRLPKNVNLVKRIINKLNKVFNG